MKAMIIHRLLLRLVVLHYYGETIYFIVWLGLIGLVMYDYEYVRPERAYTLLALAALTGYQVGYRLERAGLNITRKGRYQGDKSRAK